MKMLVTGALGATEAELEELEALGHSITLHQNEKDCVAYPQQYEAVVCNGLFLYNKIEDFTALKIIQLTSAGLDRVPADYIKAHGIALYNAEGVYSVPMAEWTLMRILEHSKNAKKLFALQSWEKDRTWQELCGKTALIVGYGAYGAETAKRLKAFGMHVVVVNRSIKQSEYADEFYGLNELDSQIVRADAVIMCIALNDSTRHMINARRLAEMPDSSLFVNAARGGLADENALIKELESGRIYAALDVFETEPLPESSPLWSMENAIISPHNSFVSSGNHARLMDCVKRNLAKAE